MVFFTCNHCGEAVKKPAVEKHYMTKCRGAPKSVSCMDCQKDFQENYVEHTKCITEMQKYSGKDYVPKESQNSGAKKQEGWTEVVRSVLDSKEYAMNGEMRKAFMTLQNYDNIPRKKAKFLNFVTNSVHLPRRIVDEVWTVLEKEQEKMKQARQAQQSSTQNGKKDETKKNNREDKGNDNGSEGEQMVNGESDQNKKRQSDADGKEIETKPHGRSEDNQKKKMKKKKRADIENKNENEFVVAAMVENTDVKKKQSCDEICPIETIHRSSVQTENGKKQKKKHNNVSESTNLKEHSINEPPSKKKKICEEQRLAAAVEETQSKKKKRNVNQEEPVQKKQNTHEISADAYTFCWETELERITDKYRDGLTLEKLKKKILKKFKLKLNQTELSERQEKGFERKLNKKLKKSITLQLDGDMVKPCS